MDRVHPGFFFPELFVLSLIMSLQVLPGKEENEVPPHVVSPLPFLRNQLKPYMTGLSFSDP